MPTYSIIAITNLAANAGSVSLNYSGSFAESAANDGSVTGTVFITLNGDTFVDPITLGTHLTVSNFSAGLTPVITRDSATQLSLTFTGSATSNINENDVSNLTVTFEGGAFTSTADASTVTNNVRNDLVIDYNDQPSISFTGSLAEASANDGSVTGTITATLTGDTYVDPITLGTHVAVSNVPSGLTANINRASANAVELTFTGNASSHENANDVSNISMIFQDGAFTNTPLSENVTGSSKTDIAIDFADAATVYGMAFDGTNKVDIGDGAYDGFANGTVEFKFKAEAAGGNFQKLIQKNGSIDIGLSNDGNLFAEIGGVANAGVVANGLDDNADHYVAISWDGTNMRTYVDGTLVNTSSQSGNQNDGSNMKFGEHVSNNNERLTGCISDVHISNTARYTGASMTVPTLPVTADANTQLLIIGNEGSGTTAADTSGNGFNGTLSSAQWCAPPTPSIATWCIFEITATEPAGT